MASPAFVSSSLFFSASQSTAFAKTRRRTCPNPTMTVKSSSSAEAPADAASLTLYSFPVSNYGARCNYLMRRKNAPSDAYAIAHVKDLGGHKSDAYLSFNPIGKIPLLRMRQPDGSEDSLYESTVICEYLIDKFPALSPSFVPGSAEQRAKARLIAQSLDLYIGPYHPYMYKTKPEDIERAEGVKRMNSGFDSIEHALDKDGPYAVGDSPSVADCCLWGNFPFYDFMLPTFFGWHPTDGRPKLAAWRTFMANESPAARETYMEVFTSLQQWWDGGRWEKLGMTPLTGRPEPLL